MKQEEKGIEWLAEAKEKYKIPIITEVMEEKYISLVSEVADILQIGLETCKIIHFLQLVQKQINLLCSKDIMVHH